MRRWIWFGLAVMVIAANLLVMRAWVDEANHSAKLAVAAERHAREEANSQEVRARIAAVEAAVKIALAGAHADNCALDLQLVDVLTPPIPVPPGTDAATMKRIGTANEQRLIARAAVRTAEHEQHCPGT